MFQFGARVSQVQVETGPVASRHSMISLQMSAQGYFYTIVLNTSPFSPCGLSRRKAKFHLTLRKYLMYFTCGCNLNLQSRNQDFFYFLFISFSTIFRNFFSFSVFSFKILSRRSFCWYCQQKSEWFDFLDLTVLSVFREPFLPVFPFRKYREILCNGECKSPRGLRNNLVNRAELKAVNRCRLTHKPGEASSFNRDSHIEKCPPE